MASKKVHVGLIVASLAAASFRTTVAVVSSNATSENVLKEIGTFFACNAVISYIFVFFVGISFAKMSIRNQWRSLWQNAIAGMSFGLCLGAFFEVIWLLNPPMDYIEEHSPFKNVLFLGLTGLAAMSALWPFIDYDRKAAEPSG